MLSRGFGPSVPGNERPQTHALDRAGTVTGVDDDNDNEYSNNNNNSNNNTAIFNVRTK